MNYALPSQKKYPIETVEQIKTASEYFSKYITNFHPAERAAIAFNMEKRAGDLGVNLNKEWVSNYARRGTQYSPDFELHMQMRKEACAGKSVSIGGKKFNACEVLEKVASRKISTSPKDMADLLYDFDKKAGLTALYDHAIRDPLYTVYGSNNNPDFDKLADSDSVMEVKRASQREGFIKKIAAAFGDGFAADLKRNPEPIFKSMPAPEKQIITEMANDELDQNLGRSA